MKLREFLSAGLMFFFFFIFLLSGKPVRGAERYIVLRRLGKFGKGRCGVENECLRERVLEGGDVGHLNLVSSSECNQPEVQLLPPSAAHLSGRMFREGE